MAAVTGVTAESQQPPQLRASGCATGCACSKRMRPCLEAVFEAPGDVETHMRRMAVQWQTRQARLADCASAQRITGRRILAEAAL